MRITYLWNLGREPSKNDKKRFPDDISEHLRNTEWWNFEDSKIEKLSDTMNDPDAFLKAIED